MQTWHDSNDANLILFYCVWWYGLMDYLQTDRRLSRKQPLNYLLFEQFLAPSSIRVLSLLVADSCPFLAPSSVLFLSLAVQFVY
jgi:hypothetical protein